MQKLFIKKEYIQSSHDPMADIVANIQRDISDELKVAMICGCQVDTTFVKEPDGIKIIIQTRNPISILKTPDGKIVDVYEKKLTDKNI